jgi:hypothetical protein
MRAATNLVGQVIGEGVSTAGFKMGSSGLWVPSGPTRAPRSKTVMPEAKKSPAVEVQTMGPASSRPGNRMADFFETMQANASFHHKRDVASGVIPKNSPPPSVGPKLAPGVAANKPVTPPPEGAVHGSSWSAAEHSKSAMGIQSGMGQIGSALGMGLIGGTTSYATGGEFGQGFAVGAAGGFAARGLKRAALNNQASPSGGLTMTKKFDNADGARGVMSSVLNSAGTGLQTMKARNAMMGGAGLSGVMFGGQREGKSHSRGFNQSRGSRF